MFNFPLEIFLLIGQSNMAGRGAQDSVPALHHPNMKMFRDGQWQPAEEPLHTDKPEIAGIGLGMSFALKLLEQCSQRVIGLVPCAVGGTSLEQWMPGGDLYANAVKTAREAQSSGTLKGILWHQGEADSQCQSNADSYGSRLSEMIAALRKEVKALNLPFITGELGGFLKEYPPCSVLFERVNAQLHTLCDSVPAYGCVSAAGLNDKGDHVHFDSDSLREFGQRYADKYQSIIKSKELYQ